MYYAEKKLIITETIVQSAKMKIHPKQGRNQCETERKKSEMHKNNPKTKDSEIISILKRMKQYAYESEAFHRLRFGTLGRNEEIIKAIRQDEDAVEILIKKLEKGGE